MISVNSGSHSQMHGGDQIRMTILGSFSLRVGGEEISVLKRSYSKTQSIICYLVLHRDRAVPQTELIGTFYGDEEQKNPTGALKMQILRIRNVFSPLLESGSSPIVNHRGSYQWNPEIPCWGGRGGV